MNGTSAHTKVDNENTSLQGSGRIKEAPESEKPLPIPVQTRTGQGCLPAQNEKALGLEMDIFSISNRKLVKIFTEERNLSFCKCF